MFEVDGIMYASEPSDTLLVAAVRYVGNQEFVVTFSTGETRLFDATELFSMPAFAPLKDEEVLRSPRVEDGVLCWLDGDIDIAPEALHGMSYQYRVPA